jgi:hypothetical protein
VAVFLYKRAEKVRHLLKSLEEVRPPRIYLFADGPRPGHPDEESLCLEARQAAEKSITWPCDVLRHYSPVNRGLRQSLEGGLDLLFQAESFAVILEDDCVPSPEFFHFCEHGDKFYREDLRIGAVTGNCFLTPGSFPASGYYYSRYPHCWGWATWKTRWQSYPRASTPWPGYQSLFPGATTREGKYWDRMYRRLDNFDSWAYPWQAHFWKQGFLCLYPGKNLVRNQGFGQGATHTRDPDVSIPWQTEGDFRLPLPRPAEVKASPELDQMVFENFYLPLEGRRGPWQKLRDRCLRFFRT